MGRTDEPWSGDSSKSHRLTPVVDQTFEEEGGRGVAGGADRPPSGGGGDRQRRCLSEDQIIRQ
jgi:hypothetical protein